MVTIAAALAILRPLVGPAIAESIAGKISEDGLEFFVEKIRGNTQVGQYYKNAVQKIYREKDSDLVGEDALLNDDIYIDAYSTDNKFPNKKILSIIQEWSREDTSGVMLIHGEPGHGKTTLCRKAVCEHILKRFCPEKTNVFWFRLNPAFAEGIIENGKFVLKKAFCWGDPEVELNRIPLEDNKKEYQNSVVFLDGYDELKAQLHAPGIKKNLKDFITTAKKIAQTYDMHIVITTRTKSLSDEGRLNIPSLQFASISEDEQNAWIEKNAPGYKEDFKALRSSSSKEMKEMLGIPILFRMVVKAELKSTTAQNVVGLYDTLFEATMERRELQDSEVVFWHQNYQDLAYKIYCNNEQFADVQGEQRADEFLYMFYIKGGNKRHVEFLHRSFYQYFLAHFLYRKMSAVKDGESAEAFLSCLAERWIDIDGDVLHYIQQIQKSKQKKNEQKVTSKKCEQIINRLEQTDTIIRQALKVPNENGNAEKHRLLRCENVLINALSICCIVASTVGSKFVISLYKRENIHTSMRRYNCSNIWLKNVDLSKADLIDADLRGAYLRGVDLVGADLIGADLSRANLSGADLSGTDLRKATLSGANLTGADLRGAINLDKCNCEQVFVWRGCKILLSDKDNLKLKNPDVRGITWCDNCGKPIKS